MTFPEQSELLKLVPATPRELGIDSPAWREGQRETIAQIIYAFTSAESVKFVMAAVPTGGGKTIIAAAVQKLLARSGLNRGSVALTHTIQLQQQYQKTLTDARLITGRGNWECELPQSSEYRIGMPDLSADTAPCTEGMCPIGLKGRGGCAYYRQWWDAADAPMVIMNYAFAARTLPIASFKEHPDDRESTVLPNPFRRSLLVADEAHLAHDAIVQASALEIWFGPLKTAGFGFPSLSSTQMSVQEGTQVKLYESVSVWSAWAQKLLPKIDDNLDALKGQREAANQRIDDEGRTPEAVQGYKDVNQAAKRLRTLKKTLTAVAKISDPDAWTVTREKGSVKLQPLWGWHQAEKMLWKHFDRVLLMSATPGDPKLVRVKLGIDESDFLYIERPSTFPVQNRPVFIWPIVKLGYSSSDADWETMAQAIVQISEKYGNRKGLVHSGSGANAVRLVKLMNRISKSERFFTHQSGGLSREEALEEFSTKKDARVLVTASFTTGLDLPWLIGWQVIAKIPFPSLGDELVARRRAYKYPNGFPFGQKVYQADTMNTVIQAAGRINRSAADSGPTFILDANYSLLVDAYRPKFYNEAVQRLSLEA